MTAYINENDDKQLWDANELSTGEWGFIYNKGNGLVMDVKGASGNQGTKVITWSKKDQNNSNQLWKHQYEDGFIISQQTGFVLDIAGANRDAGTNIIVWGKKTRDNAQNQQWTLLDTKYVDESGLGKNIDNIHF